MKQVVLLLSIIMTTVITQAQEGSWTIKLNGKTLLATSKENEQVNSKLIKATEWKKNGFLEIRFKEVAAGWIRHFILFDEGDNQLLNKDSCTYAKIPLVSLRTIFAGKKEVRIYTIVAPADPSMAVRVRRVHLCTLRLQ